jgi:hypothetical protein
VASAWKLCAAATAFTHTWHVPLAPKLLHTVFIDKFEYERRESVAKWTPIFFGALLLPTSSSKGNEEGEEDKVCHEKSFFRQDACSDWRFAWPTRLKSGVKQVVYTSKAIVLFRSSVKEHLQKEEIVVGSTVGT